MEDLMKKKQEEMISNMILVNQRFLEYNWYKNLDAVYMAGYKISYKVTNKKTKDWYTVTMTPYLEKY